ncbi:MAG TPA: LysE family translocator [Chthoniobacterales bacterium]|nr:LysE family translocator [Chthoniobacterales bacterium]
MNEQPLFFTGMALLVMAPGPDFMNVMSQSLRGDLRIGLMSAVGVGAGLCVHVSAAILGLLAVLIPSALAYEVLRWVGAAYLVYLGVRSLLCRSKIEPTGFATGVSSDRHLDRAFRTGFLVNVLNPKVAITFMAFMPQFVHPEKGQVWLQFLLLGIATIIFACSWFSCVAMAVHFAGAKIRRNKTFWRIQEKVTGCILVAFGLRLALEERR